MGAPRVVVVTGASLAFARDGARGRERLGGRALAIPADVASAVQLVLEQPLEPDPAATLGRRLRDLPKSVV